MRIDPESKVETEIADLKNQVAELRKECSEYFKIIEQVCSRRDGWKQSRTTGKYGCRF